MVIEKSGNLLTEYNLKTNLLKVCVQTKKEIEIAIDSYSYKTRKKYRIVPKNNNLIIYIYICIMGKCSGSINVRQKLSTWFISKIKDHCCSKLSFFVPQSLIVKEIENTGISFHNLKDLKNIIRQKYPSEKPSRIVRIYQSLNRMLESNSSAINVIGIVEKIKEEGGDCLVKYNENGEIAFIGVISKLSIIFLKSDFFFGTIICDSTFITSISRGFLICCSIKLWNKKISPISFAWTSEENADFWGNLLILFTRNDILIKTIISDQGTAMLSGFNLH